MNRETAINVLLGTLLIAACAAPFVAVMGALWLAFYVTDAVVRHFWPSVSLHPDAILNAFMCLGIVFALFQLVRERLWRNAFLTLTAGVTFALCWLCEPSRSSRHFADDPTLWLVVLALVVFSQKVPIPRREFFAAAALNTTVSALTTGLFGLGTFARIVSTCAWLAAVAWIIISARRDVKWDGPRPGALSLKSS